MKEAPGTNGELYSQMMADILDLAVVCPHDNTNPPFCPLYKVRKLEPGERIKWVLQLSGEEMDDITVHHRVCLKCRSDGAQCAG